MGETVTQLPPDIDHHGCIALRLLVGKPHALLCHSFAAMGLSFQRTTSASAPRGHPQDFTITGGWMRERDGSE